ncbi:hypothetical protein AJ80_06878 [Polytolypa hystricis UAMH7299]|uniref:CENP-V/GFA domain-containing protein n=1 Tax=Polytolypa hystricis (strain UAMH7299) TaxID=1447883 RepID=A0A2B7XSX1_POLH7|nr:hypothetical protein AJ80_06878 [Polytolypa hystricis UAMH7299]
MSQDRVLRGSCSCGRNQYIISLPPGATDQAEVYFSNDRRTPLAAWLRVPLAWYQSYTNSFYPDESHSTIRRTFFPPHPHGSQRNFCGFCGTPLTYWCEDPPEEAEYMSVTVGSLYGDDQGALEDLELLPRDSDMAEPSGAATSSSAVVPVPSASPTRVGTTEPLSVSHRSGVLAGIPWFEEMIEGSRLGRVAKRTRGMGVSSDQSMQIEWEVSEWHDEPSEASRGRLDA